MKLLPACLLLTCIVACSHHPVAIRNRVVAILPYKGVDTSLLPFIAHEVAQFYHCKTALLSAQPLPSNAYYAARQRYKADSLLLYQKQLLVPDAVTVLGITASDISTANGAIADWGVMGLGYCPGKACVISTWRLHSTTFGQFKERLCKVVLHELGHNLGMPHCTSNDTCMMNDARGTIAQVDKERKWLCPHCTSLLAK